MEDRHSFSDPRPVFGSSLPTWEVDVFREGVEEPVLTLTVNKETLPPRMGKKKKIAWKLPDSQDIKPNFAAAEKARLYDMFKAQKKNRRKSKRNSQNTSTNTNTNSATNTTERATTETTTTTSSSSSSSSSNNTIDSNTINNPNPADDDDDNDADDGSDDTSPTNASTIKPDTIKPLRQEETFLPSSSLDDSRPTIPSNSQPTQQSVIATPTAGTPSPPPPPPPPGLSNVTPSPLQARSSFVSSIPPPGFAHLIIQEEDDGMESQKKYFCPLTSNNIPTELAQLFMDIYYSSLTHGEDSALLDYYTDQAQKSLSVGTAHAYCQSPSEIRIQLERLRGSMWDIRGIVTQPSIADSVVLLLTGTTLPKASRNTLPFCHAVTLIRVSQQGYQIHNDAMSLIVDG